MIALGNLDVTAALTLFVVLLVSNTVHEAAHALAAKLGGDLTAYRGGQVSLNPLPHIQREPSGMVVLPLLTIFASGGSMCMGFASAPIDPIWAFHHPKRAALVSLAGPLSNILVAAIAFFVLQAIGYPETSEAAAVQRIAATFLMLNLLLAVFNLLPLPPLDGAGVLSGLSKTVRVFYDNLQRLPMSGVITLIVAIYVMPSLFTPVWRTVISWLDAPLR
jgi:Zn-dependent protease